ncbi:MAG: metallophosphoesterase [Bacteroidota bacterium]
MYRSLSSPIIIFSIRSTCRFLVFLFFPIILNAQSVPNHKAYLIGNIAGLKPESPYFQQLLKQLNSEQQPTSLLVLGDMSKKNRGKGAPSWNEELLTAFAQIQNPKVKIHFISGDRDWDNSGKDGWAHVKLLETYLKNNVNTDHSFSPDDGCPGPHEIEVGDDLVIITINSQWFMHPHERPALTSSTCDVLFEEEFWEELEDAIDDNSDKNVIVAAHHPVYSSGYFSGKVYDWKTFIPIFGGPYLSYKRNDGSPRDMSNSKYKIYTQKLKRILSEHNNVIYVSGHEFDTQIMQAGDHYFINSGATYKSKKTAKYKRNIFRSSKLAFTVLEYFKDGKVDSKVIDKFGKVLFEKNLFCSNCDDNEVADCTSFNYRLNPCQQALQYEVDSAFIKKINTDLATIIPGIQYEAGKFRTKMMGQLYRSEWTTPVKLPYLDIGSYEGGMVPFAKGGGKQTDALKFVLPDGRQFGFRSVNKNVRRNTDYVLNNTVVSDFNQELIANQLPFGDVVTSVLLDNTDILHMRPRAYVMPDDPRLGKYREQFAGLVGTVEERPKSKKKNRSGFAGADKIKSSNAMYRYLFKSHENKLDKQAVARAFMFDVWVGDWDRHGDNWKWAGYKEGKHYLFKPIPKDRDHVFPIYEGKILKPYLKFTPHTANFDEEINSVYNLMFQGRHLTNFLNSKLDKSDWQEAADYLQSVFNEENIAEAFEYLPEEIRDFSSEELKKTLLARLDELDKIPDYIEERFSKQGLILGSNEKEIFEIERKPSGDVTIKMYSPRDEDSERTLLQEKTFSKNVTEEIHVYGLGGNDQFYVLGNTTASILVRIIGGEGNDVIQDFSKVTHDIKQTLVYDTEKEDTIVTSEETMIHRPYYSPQYNVYDFESSYLIPNVSPYFASDEQIGIYAKFTKVGKGFNKPVFKDKKILLVKYIPGLNSIKVKPDYIYNDFINNQNLRLRGRMAINDTSYDDIYGLGNDSEFSDALDDERFYKVRSNNYAFSAGLEKGFFSRSHFRYSVGIEHHHIRIDEEESLVAMNRDVPEYALGRNSMVFFRTSFDIDLLDQFDMPDDGVRIEIENTLYRSVEGDFETYGKLEASAIQYFTTQLIRPTTWIVKLGGGYNYGDAPYYHMVSLGNNRNLRAYNSNQFVGTSGMYVNTMLRYDLGTIGKKFLPLDIGLLAFHDRGRVFFKDQFSFEDWQSSYGGGAYITFLRGKMAINFLVGRNEFNDLFVRSNLGFSLE